MLLVPWKVLRTFHSMEYEDPAYMIASTTVGGFSRQLMDPSFNWRLVVHDWMEGAPSL